LTFTLLLILYHLFFSSNLDTQRAKLTEEQQSLNELQQQANFIQQETLKYGDQPLQKAKLTAVKRQLQQQQAILKHLGDDNILPHSGFSFTLEGLSKHHLDQVWLDKFSLREGGHYITIQGRSQQSELIPEYIDTLAKAKAFEGKQFSVFQMSTPDNSDSYEFELHTTNGEQYE